jgi:hypothetical protein
MSGVQEAIFEIFHDVDEMVDNLDAFTRLLVLDKEFARSSISQAIGECVKREFEKVSSTPNEGHLTADAVREKVSEEAVSVVRAFLQDEWKLPGKIVTPNVDLLIDRLSTIIMSHVDLRVQKLREEMTRLKMNSADAEEWLEAYSLAMKTKIIAGLGKNLERAGRSAAVTISVEALSERVREDIAKCVSQALIETGTDRVVGLFSAPSREASHQNRDDTATIFGRFVFDSLVFDSEANWGSVVPAMNEKYRRLGEAGRSGSGRMRQSGRLAIGPASSRLRQWE